MAKRIDKIDMPASTPSGKPFDVTVDYSSEEGGTMTITYATGFTGSPPSVDLPPGGRKPFAMTITRRNGAALCRVEFVFGNKVVKTIAVT